MGGPCSLPSFPTSSRGLCRAVLVLGSLAALALAPSAVLARVQQIDRMIVIGDSLSDGGNSGLLTQTAVPPAGIPASPYAGGRWSNGPVAAEQLWQLFNPSAAPLKPSQAGGTNFAVVGATTGSANVVSVDPNFPSALRPLFANTAAAAQLPAAVAAADPDPQRSLYLVWLGANDGLYWMYTGGSASTSGSTPGTASGAAPQAGATAAQLVANGVQNISTVLSGLIGKGARHILVSNLIDFGKAPGFSSDAAKSAQITQMVNALNAGIHAEMQVLRAANPQADLMEFDAYAMFNEVLANPTGFSFDNITNRCVLPNQSLDPGCDPNRWFFWDGSHPTTAAHALIASRMFSTAYEAPVPAPLPLAGAAVAFSWARRLRRRLLSA